MEESRAPEDDPAKARRRRKELGLSCMLNTEVGAVLAVIRRPSSEASAQHQYVSGLQDEAVDSSILHSLKSLRALIFNPQQEWRMIDPSVYLSPFLDVVQSDDVPAAATGVALSALIKVLKMGIFDEKTPGARDAINSVVTGIVNCRLGKTDPGSEEAVLMRILQVLSSTMRHRASILLSDQAVCTLVNTCFQVVQQSSSRGSLLQRNARYTMHELIQIIFSRLPEIDLKEGENSESDTDDVYSFLDSGYGVRCTVDIFHFLCSLMNVVEVVETDGSTSQSADEDVQIFALVLINSAVELSGDSIGRHPKLLRMIQDDLFHHLVHYGTSSSQLVLAMICSTVLSVYHFLRSFIRLQLEAFFSYVLFRAALQGPSSQIQEVATEGIINFCRQPAFIFETYVNYDCNFMCPNVFEEIGKLLCRHAFPTSSSLSSLQLQAFEGLVILIHNIADNINMEDPSTFKPRAVEVTEYRAFWEEKPEEEDENWVDSVRLRKAQKRKIMIARNHYNLDDKKGLDYLKISNLVSGEAPDAKAYASFFRFTPGLEKVSIGDYLGDPDEFHIMVLKEFTDTFEFSGMVLDTALRTYLETFRLPGESQKIHRIIEAFADRYYDQQSSETFASKDAVLVLSYSIIMLNTDQHNPQVKKKMTEEEFIRNNRAINGGNDLPREYLSELFHSISTNEIKINKQTMSTQNEMSPSRWVELMNRSRSANPFFRCNFDGRLGRDMFATIAGPSVATLCACFEQAEEDELLHECAEGLFSIGRIAQYGLEDTLDELVAGFCKFTMLLNPYASSEETLFTFSNDLKSRMATLAVFTIANSFGFSIRGGWRNIVDCLLKLRRLKLLPQTVVEPDADPVSPSDASSTNFRSESGMNFHNQDPRFSNGYQSSGMIGQFSHFLALDGAEDSLTLGASEFEQNLKIIKQCRIGSIFTRSRHHPDAGLVHLGRSLIFAAAGKGQKFSTPIEEEETVGFCWDLINTITISNIHRFSAFWPSFHDNLIAVAQFPFFSPIPFTEKAMCCLLKLCLKLVSTRQADMLPEELIFRSITLMWKLEKEILEICSEVIFKMISRILVEFPENIQTQLGWKSLLHLLVVTGRNPETYDQGVETLITILSNTDHLSRINYMCCIDCAFGFIGLKSCPVDKKIKILDLLIETMNLLIQWHKTGFSDPAVNNYSTTSSSSMEENSKALGASNLALNMFVKLGEFLKNTSLARREEVRNHAIQGLGIIFPRAENLDFMSTSCMKCFNLVVCAMVDDLHEKVLVYSRRENVEVELRSWEESLKLSMRVLTNVFLHFLKLIWENPGFRTFWLGVLRRMDTCMKADLGSYGMTSLKELVPELLRQMILKMKEDDILLPREGDDLSEITYIQIQWIAPSLKDELFPDL
ncbi:hypothetical protein SAY86_018270 [Trapa natans]|uniref:SEC7 domain-containing protein n=1 Tax=Trapa natans TaxID=22666 RepID=A0AAN7QYN1_TRANT|nr:hypothetical protein SAY86_018270 [Trapa natans]